MGLRANHDKVLAEIETALRGSDPRLACMFNIFCRLHVGEEMPRLEQRRARARARPATRRLAAVRRWLVVPRRSRLRTALFFPVSAAFPPARCPAVHRAARTAPVTRVVGCSPARGYPLYLGR